MVTAAKNIRDGDRRSIRGRSATARSPHRREERNVADSADPRHPAATLGRRTTVDNVANEGCSFRPRRRCSFLAALTKRTGVAAANPPPPAHVIADCLGLSVGTVSRILRDFEDPEAITFSGRDRVEIVNPDAPDQGSGEDRQD